MGYPSLRQCVEDLQRNGELVRIDQPVDARLEAAAIHRRVNAAGGPALLFANVSNCQFPLVSNLFGTMDRVRLMFRDGLEAVQQLVEMRAQPTSFLKRPWRYLGTPRSALTMLPARVKRGPVLANQTTISMFRKARTPNFVGVRFARHQRDDGRRRIDVGG